MTMTTYTFSFGSQVRGERTGIIFNDEMDDFSTPGAVNAWGFPASPSNYIVPGKRPQSSMSPTILLDNEGEVRFMVGSEGGSRIISTIANVSNVVLQIIKQIKKENIKTEKNQQHPNFHDTGNASYSVSI